MIKKILFVSALSLVFIGAGCFGGQRDERWALSFDLPEGWAQYAEGEQDFAGSPEGEISPQDPEITLQSTADAINLEGESDRASFEGQSVRTEDFAVIRATRLDERRKISDDAEDLGKGLFRESRCKEDDPCRAEGVHEYRYYFVNGESKYQFVIITNGRTADEAVKVIESVKPVRIR